MAIQPGELVIDDTTPIGTTHPDGFARGALPRDYEAYPTGFYASAPPFDLPLIPRNEYVERIRDMEANQSRLSDIRRSSGPNGGLIPSLDQNGIPYCWTHSVTMAVMLIRAVSNEPYKRLSACMLGCLLKNYRPEGGWGALALDFATLHGVPTVEFWAEKSMSRTNDTPAMRANALLHRPIESWVDLNASVYDRNLTDDQAMTVLLTRTPLVGDFNFWAHSVCLMDPVVVREDMANTDFESLDLNDPKDAAVMGAAFGKRGVNSWTDQWGDKGEFVLTGTKAILDGGVAPRTVTPSNT